MALQDGGTSAERIRAITCTAARAGRLQAESAALPTVSSVHESVAQTVGLSHKEGKGAVKAVMDMAQACAFKSVVDGAETVGLKPEDFKGAVEAPITCDSVAETVSMKVEANGAVEAPITHESVAQTVSLKPGKRCGRGFHTIAQTSEAARMAIRAREGVGSSS